MKGREFHLVRPEKYEDVNCHREDLIEESLALLGSLNVNHFKETKMPYCSVIKSTANTDKPQQLHMIKNLVVATNLKRKTLLSY